MPPTDDHDLGSRHTADVTGNHVYPADTRVSMESRALRQQLDRARTLQQKNDVISGDKQMSARREGSGSKPYNVKNYYNWLRTVAEGGATAPSSASPCPASRPRSRSLQLDASDVSMFTKAGQGVDKSPGNISSRKQVKTVAKLPLGSLRRDQASDEEKDQQSPPQCSSPKQHRSPNRMKSISRKEVPTSTRKCAKSNSFSNNVKTRPNNDYKVKCDRGLVIKPKAGPMSGHSVLSPIKRQRSRSLDVDGAKIVAEVSEFHSPRTTPVLPDISPEGSDSNEKIDISIENSSPGQDSKEPVSILKKCKTSRKSSNKGKTQYAVHVTFNDMTTMIPFGYPADRRESIAEENMFSSDQVNEKRGRRLSPPPPLKDSTNDRDKSPWLAPGVFPGIRRNSLPPLSVTLSEIQAVGSDDDDDDILFRPIAFNKDRHIDIEITEMGEGDSRVTSPSAALAYVKSDSDSDNSKASDTCYSPSAWSKPIQTPASCFSVSRHSQQVDIDSDDGIQCHVVHSFTPRPKLKNNVLSNASNAIHCASGSL